MPAIGKLSWDLSGERLFETGVRKAVLYVQHTDGTYPLGVAWNGMTAMTESPEGAEATAYYADDIKYLNLMSAEDFKGTIEAYMYPDAFAVCDGSVEVIPGVKLSQQTRKPFGVSYVTVLGNDLEGTSYGYKVHLTYGMLINPSERAFASVGESVEPNTFSWAFSTTAPSVTGYKPSATLVIDSTKCNPAKLAALEDILYGVDTPSKVDARLPLPDEVLTLLAV